MLKIAVCEDELLYQKNISKWLEEVMAQERIQCYKVDIYKSGMELLALGDDIGCYQAVLLDADMMDGMQTGASLQEMNRNIQLIFMTAQTGLRQENDRTRVFRYVLKGNRNQLQEALLSLIQLEGWQEVAKQYEFREGSLEIKISQILYIESERHTMRFHLEGGEVYAITGKLDQMEVELKNSRFIRIHKSYLVNYQHIKTISNYQAVLDENCVLPIPREKYRRVKNIYQELKNGMMQESV